MKKIILIVLMCMLFIPSIKADDILYDSNFSTVKNTANNYITKMSDYYLYLVTSDLSKNYVYNGSGFSALSGFDNAGLLNKFEYSASLDSNNTTYLNDGQKYWTLTSGTSSSSHYYINLNGPESTLDTSLYGARPTQYIQEDTSIKGKGTFAEPWEFITKNDSFTITFKDSNTTGTIMPTVSYAIGYNEDAKISLTAPAGRTINTTTPITCSPAIDATGTLSNSNKTINVNLRNIKKSSTCTINTEIQNFTVSVSSTNTTYGTVSPASLIINYNNNAVFTVSPKTGYIYNSNTCGGVMSGNTMTIYNITANKTCTVTFAKAPITVTFNANSGYCSIVSMLVYYGNTYSGLPTSTQTTRSGYNFNGWYTAASGGTRVYDTTTVTKTANHTLYAQWTPNSRTFYVRHYVQNASGTNVLSATNTYTVNYGTTVTFTNYKNSTYNSGYTYYSYATYQATSSSSAVNQSSATITANGAYINIYYVRYRYTVSTSAQSGISSMSGSGTYYAGATASIYSYPSTYYKFNYYYTSTGIANYNRSYSFVVTSNITVYGYGTMCTPTYTCWYGTPSGSQCYYTGTMSPQQCRCVCGGGSSRISDTGYYYTLGRPQCGYHASVNSSGCDTSGAAYERVATRSSGSPYYKSWRWKYKNYSSSSESNSHWYQWWWHPEGSSYYTAPYNCGCSVDYNNCSGGNYTCPQGGTPYGSTCYYNASQTTPASC